MTLQHHPDNPPAHARSVPGIRRITGRSIGYSRISDEFARDPELTPRGSRVGLYALSHRDGWVMTQRSVATALRMAETTVRDALGDLADLGYLRSWTVRNDHGHVVGTAYLVHDERLSDEQWAIELHTAGAPESLTAESTVSARPAETQDSLPGDSLGRDSLGRESPAHKGDQFNQGDHGTKGPSGGRAARRRGRRDDPPPGLFAAPDPPPAAEPREPAPAQAIVARYVDAYREAHDGRDPRRDVIAHVGRDARRMVDDPSVTLDELLAAAASLGLGTFRDLGREVDILRSSGQRTVDRRPARSLPPAPPAPPGSFTGGRAPADEPEFQPFDPEDVPRDMVLDLRARATNLGLSWSETVEDELAWRRAMHREDHDTADAILARRTELLTQQQITTRGTRTR